MNAAPSTQNTLPLYTIYYNTIDWPGEYVIKRWYVTPPHDSKDKQEHMNQDLSYRFNAATLEACRTELQGLGLANIGRQKEDDAVIVESWI